MSQRDSAGHHRQAVLDASLRLQLVRARFCDDLAARRRCDAEVAVFGTDQAALRDWLQEQCGNCTELVAVTWTRHQTLESFLSSHRYNRVLVERGVRMTSFFDTSEGVPEVTDFIVAVDDMPYHLAHGPVQLKVFDGERVLVEGPAVDGRRSLMVMRGQEVVNAAGQYLRAVRSGASRAADLRVDRRGLTARQHVIAAQLGDGRTDDEIAERLELSVRTVRYEVSRLMAALGVKTRFAAGLRYAAAEPPSRRLIAGSCNDLDRSSAAARR